MANFCARSKVSNRRAKLSPPTCGKRCSVISDGDRCGMRQKHTRISSAPMPLSAKRWMNGRQPLSPPPRAPAGNEARNDFVDQSGRHQTTGIWENETRYPHLEFRTQCTSGNRRGHSPLDPGPRSLAFASATEAGQQENQLRRSPGMRQVKKTRLLDVIEIAPTEFMHSLDRALSAYLSD